MKRLLVCPQQTSSTEQEVASVTRCRGSDSASTRIRQLPLAQNHRSALPEAYRHQAIVARQLVYGCLFDHIDAAKLATPDFIHPHCRRGRWLSIDEWAQHFPADTPSQIIPKALWPVPLERLKDLPLEPWSRQSPIDRCLMLRVNDDPTPYFVTPPDYPEPKADQ